MSSTSLNDSIEKNLIEPLSQKSGSQISTNSRQDVDDKSLLGSTCPSSIYENNPSIPLVAIRVSPVSTSQNSVNEKIQSAIELENIVTLSCKHFQSLSDSYDSHTFSNYDENLRAAGENLSFDSNETIELPVCNGDLHLRLAEEQDDGLNACGKHRSVDKRLTTNNEIIENLVSVTLAFKEASHNQCDLLRAQTNAINRLATAIEDQNAMMIRFHTFVKKNSTENIGNNDIPPRDDKH